jgi:hypothetical protein
MAASVSCLGGSPFSTWTQNASNHGGIEPPDEGPQLSGASNADGIAITDEGAARRPFSVSARSGIR